MQKCRQGATVVRLPGAGVAQLVEVALYVYFRLSAGIGENLQISMIQ